MALLVTKNHSAERAGKDASQRSYLEWTVSGSADIDEVLSASALPAINTEHYKYARQLCEGPRVTSRSGLETWIVGADFSVPQTGEHNITSSDAITQEPKLSLSPVEISEVVDVDYSGRPILSASGFPYSSNPTRTFIADRLQVRQNERYINIPKMIAYRNKVNAAAMTVLGLAIEKEHMLCESIHVEGSWTQTSQYYPIVYSFLVLWDDALGEYPWQWRMLNASSKGWYSYTDPVTSSTKIIPAGFSSDGDPLSESIPVDLSGLPLGSAYSNIMVAGQPPVARPGSIVPYKTETKPNATFHIFQARGVVDMVNILNRSMI